MSRDPNAEGHDHGASDPAARAQRGEDQDARAEDAADTNDAGPGADHDHAAFAAETVRLIGAVQDWVQQALSAVGGADYSGTTCQWCPLCQFISVLRGDRPEATERVASAGSTIATIVQALLDSAREGAGSGEAAPAGARTESTDAADSAASQDRQPGAGR